MVFPDQQLSGYYEDSFAIQIIKKKNTQLNTRSSSLSTKPYSLVTYAKKTAIATLHQIYPCHTQEQYAMQISEGLSLSADLWVESAFAIQLDGV